jgi:hypothetical protein
MTPTFQRTAGVAAVVTAALGIAFTVAFAVVVREGERWAEWASWTTLLAGGLITVPVLLALHALLVRAEPQFATTALVLGLAGSLGAAVHAAYEIALLEDPPVGAVALPSATDPRGFMTFGVAGLALGVFGWLILHTGALPRRLGWLAAASAVLLVIVYVARLTVLDPNANVIRITALASGLVTVPGFYVLLGRALLDGRPRT